MVIVSEEITRPSSSEIEIPLGLREFGEIPGGYVSVYIVIKKERLNQIIEEGGILIRGNKRNEILPKLEEIFKEEGKKYRFGVDRIKCVFAYPRPLGQIRLHLHFDPGKQVILEAKIDPNTAIVANGEFYTQAGEELCAGTEERAKNFANLYWETAKPLVQYLSERHNGSDNDFLNDFLFPEVLTPSDIPSSHLKLIHS